MNTIRPIHRVLVSVYYKDGLDILAQAFIAAGTQVVSTGSTAKALEDLGVKVIPVSEVTGFPECLGGRVKTLDPHIHAGILADMTNEGHVQELSTLSVDPFDMVIVNLYPFVETVNSGASTPECIEKIDIGGPTMIRAAAKNSRSVAVITDPDDYVLAAQLIEQKDGFTLEQRQALATKAFAHTAAYDAAISQWMNLNFDQCRHELLSAAKSAKAAKDTQDNGLSIDQDQNTTTDNSNDIPSLPSTWSQSWSLDRTLRYGENPHQQAALYLDVLQPQGLAKAIQLGGKPMSYNNYVDADAAWRAAWDFAPRIAVAVVKHNNPCGIAVGATVEEAHRKAHACDPMSAYGGVIASTVPVTLAMAEQIRPIFTEVIVAPDYEPDALALLQEKKKNLRILKVDHQDVLSWQMRQIDGGLLVQSSDTYNALGDDPQTWKLVAGEPANDKDMADLIFAWRAIRCVKSNAVLLAHDEAAVGIGMGQVNRVDACHLCVERANTLAGDAQRAQGAVAASDAFFPFADGVEYLIKAGVKAIVQPGGSIRDEEVFETARQHGVTMYVTGTRHFLH